MHFKQAAPPNGTQSSCSHMRPFVAALLLIAGGAWLALALQARSMGLMPVTMGIAMRSFVVMWTLMVDAWAGPWSHSSSQWNAYAESVNVEVYHVAIPALGCQWVLLRSV
jgi:hypothetical protein